MYRRRCLSLLNESIVGLLRALASFLMVQKAHSGRTGGPHWSLPTTRWYCACWTASGGSSESVVGVTVVNVVVVASVHYIMPNFLIICLNIWYVFINVYPFTWSFADASYEFNLRTFLVEMSCFLHKKHCEQFLTYFFDQGCMPEKSRPHTPRWWLSVLCECATLLRLYAVHILLVWVAIPVF